MLASPQLHNIFKKKKKVRGTNIAGWNIDKKKKLKSQIQCNVRKLVGMFLFFLLSTDAASEGIRLTDYFLDSSEWSHTGYCKDP